MASDHDFAAVSIDFIPVTYLLRDSVVSDRGCRAPRVLSEETSFSV